MFIGLILIAVGVFALLLKLGVLSGSLWSYVWPSILIALGLSFLCGRIFGRSWWCCWRREEKGGHHGRGWRHWHCADEEEKPKKR